MMNKKIFALVMLVVVCLAGCGNMSIGLGDFTFEKVHVDTYHNEACFTVEKWFENGAGIEVRTKEVGPIFLSEGTYTLISDECPFCGQED